MQRYNIYVGQEIAIANNWGYQFGKLSQADSDLGLSSYYLRPTTHDPVFYLVASNIFISKT